MIKDLVNILTPAYNGEKLITRLLDSVLLQDYPYISMIVINDGSTDRTQNIVEQYIPRFTEKGFQLKLFNQPNGGQANAINNGLKHVDGEFLVWPDSDDWYASPSAISKLVEALKSYDDEVAVAYCAYNRVLEDGMKLIRTDYPCLTPNPSNIFEDAVRGGAHFWLEPGGWMIKTKFLDEFIPNREIYQSRLTGQNTQILWPYLFYKKCISVEEPLFSYLIRKNSHSRAFFKDLDVKIKQQEEIYATFIAVLHSIKGLDRKTAEKLLITRRKYLLTQKFQYLQLAGRWDEMHKCYNQIKNLYINQSVERKIKIKNIISFIPLIRDIILNRRLNKKALFLILLIISVLINIIGIFIFVSPKIMRKYYQYSFEPINCNTENAFEARLKKSTLIMLEDNVATDESVIYYHTIDDFIHHVLKRDKHSVFQYGEFGYFLHYLFQYSLYKGDEQIMNKIKDKVDKELLNAQGHLLISRNDQCSYGCILLDLYNKFGEQKYKISADKILNRLDSIDKVDGIVKYRENTHRQDVDVIGLVCPFLNMYSSQFKSKRCSEIAANMINQYARYGMDESTGLPSQAYDTNSKIKIGYANWGRGCGWFCLGISDLEKNNLDSISTKKIERLNKTLISMAPLYEQYIGQKDESKIDMSSTIFILYYLKKNHLLRFTKSSFIKTISPYISSDGYVKYNSPSIGRAYEIPNAFQKHHVSQALALYMLTLK